jgi:methyl-accepting chemotaxis protein
VSALVGTMREITVASKRVHDIISVIDGIAFQTNLLALNAAVEAARAGEHGRGFAVVASEVRTLSQRAAAAAKEIKQLIDDTVTKVAQGSLIVEETGTDMSKVVNAIESVSELMTEIAASNSEQAAGIEQVNAAVQSMDQTTQQNAALAERTTQATQGLLERTEALVAEIQHFQQDAAAPVNRRAA